MAPKVRAMCGCLSRLSLLPNGTPWQGKAKAIIILDMGTALGNIEAHKLEIMPRAGRTFKAEGCSAAGQDGDAEKHRGELQTEETHPGAQ